MSASRWSSWRRLSTLSRAEAAQHFAHEIAHLAQSIDPPKTLLVAGGETLKAQMLAVGARALAGRRAGSSPACPNP